jgi:hypothetical protein
MYLIIVRGCEHRSDVEYECNKRHLYIYVHIKRVNGLFLLSALSIKVQHTSLLYIWISTLTFISAFQRPAHLHAHEVDWINSNAKIVIVHKNRKYITWRFCLLTTELIQLKYTINRAFVLISAFDVSLSPGAHFLCVIEVEMNNGLQLLLYALLYGQITYSMAQCERRRWKSSATDE